MNKMSTVRKRVNGKKLLEKYDVRCKHCGSQSLMLLGQQEYDGELNLTIMCSACRIMSEITVDINEG